MNFFYHPILDLQFTCGLSIFEIDLDCIPQVNFEEALKLLSQKGVAFINSNHQEAITGIYTEITTKEI